MLNNMALRNMRVFIPSLKSIRNMSSSAGSLVNVSVNEKSGIATVEMNSPPVNSLNLELLNEMVTTFKNLESNKSRGLILTSSSNKVFSAGLDIREMYKPELNRFKKFWTTLQDTWLELFGSSYPTVAVINGHAPAGGCLMALSCEYRIMLPNFSIGLNETQLGIVAPEWFIASMKNTISARDTELALTTGSLFKTDDAMKIGLIDEIVNTKEEGIERAEQFLQRFTKIPRQARTLTKQMLRGPALQKLLKTKDAEVDVLVNFVTDSKVQNALGMYLENLKRKQTA